MKAIRVEQFGEPEVMKLADVPKPRPESGQVHLAEAPQAHRAVREPGAFGKIVLIPQEISPEEAPILECGMERAGRAIRQLPDHEGSGERSWS
ncbi:MAG: hypothetical protein DME86_12440 [Verrucomicrobia bacterium]|nr:MAG: hypothetical protein DME86_12440 [Verrucomicrobiota bacterium]